MVFTVPPIFPRLVSSLACLVGAPGGASFPTLFDGEVRDTKDRPDPCAIALKDGESEFGALHPLLLVFLLFMLAMEFGSPTLGELRVGVTPVFARVGCTFDESCAGGAVAEGGNAIGKRL